MLFPRASNIDWSTFKITTLKGSDIAIVNEYKHLGIWLDDKCTFKQHVNKRTCKLRQKRGSLYRNKVCLPKHTRKKIIEATLLPVLDYGDVLYRDAPVTTLKSLDSVYHAALRFITGDPYNTHHCILYEKVGWSSLSVRRETHWLLFIYKEIGRAHV